MGKQPLWSTKARQGHPLHRICSYQGVFPPQIPKFFLGLVPEAQVVLDPFVGRGTVVLEAVLLGKTAFGVDVNPVAVALSSVKLRCDKEATVIEEIENLNLSGATPPPPEEIEPFYHPETWEQVYNLRQMQRSPALTALALGRLHGHSSGFFSTETYNAFSVHGKSLRKAQLKHGTNTQYRDVKMCLLRAAEHFIPFGGVQGKGEILKGSATALPLPDSSVDMVVTSPPFLDAIDYADINWLRLWFLNDESPKTFIRNASEYKAFLRASLRELSRVLRPEGHIVFEVGPIKRNQKLSDTVVEASKGILHVEQVLTQNFAGAGVSKISRAMTKGKETTTMENNCVIMRPLDSGQDLEIPWVEEAPSLFDLLQM